MAAIYGANASGKTSLVKAFAYLRSCVRGSFRIWEADAGVPRMPFFLDAEHYEKETEVEVEFRGYDGLEYTYGFGTDGSEILTEWLYVYRTSHRSVLYERGIDEDEPVRFGASFKGPRVELRAAVAKRPNALVLSIAAQLGIEIIDPAYKWITRSLNVYDAHDYEAEHRKVMDRLEHDQVFSSKLTKILSKADLGIAKVDVVEEELPSHYENMEKVFDALGQKYSAEDIEKFKKQNARKLQLTHVMADDSVAFPFMWESKGTQAFISFASIALHALELGNVLIVDEIDTSLHPILVGELVRLFQSRRTNPRQAQMIFTTHDVSLLSKRSSAHPVLARDQIWLVEKSAEGASSLVALSEYRTPRKEENLERGYMTGRYGGIPTPDILEVIAEATDDAAGR
ncbi:AAA family ATPase [Paenarthrobacter ureafaciens]|uniref:AAA family ATPase n=1 Tax=Paenarthrobacter ureafaciens TaxID=37931 RepID=UPI003CF0C2A0